MRVRASYKTFIAFASHSVVSLFKYFKNISWLIKRLTPCSRILFDS